MLISTKGRYGLRIMTLLALRYYDEDYISLRRITDLQDLPYKYTERIIKSLVQEKFLEVKLGKNGGYRLSRPPHEYTVAEILKSTEGDLAPVQCLCDNQEPCTMMDTCTTIPMWVEFDQMVWDFLNSKKLTDLSTNTLQKWEGKAFKEHKEKMISERLRIKREGQKEHN